MALKSALMDDIEIVCRRKGYSPKTAKTYRFYCEKYLLFLNRIFHQWLHPKEANEEQVQAWLTELACVDNVSPTTQNVALQAVLFLYREILKIELKDIDALRAKRPKRLPTVLSKEEMQTLLGNLKGTNKLIASLLYGCGMRIGEAVSLRLKDLDFGQRQIMIRGAKGAKDRVVGMPQILIQPLKRQVESVRKLHADDSSQGCNRVELPYAFSRKSPQSAGDLAWYWLFPSRVLSRHPSQGWIGRYHVDQSNFGRELKKAGRRCGILKRVYPHALRHSFATHCLNQGMNIKALMQLLGHNDIKTTQIYTHVELVGVTAETSPLDRLIA